MCLSVSDFGVLNLSGAQGLPMGSGSCGSAGLESQEDVLDGDHIWTVIRNFTDGMRECSKTGKKTKQNSLCKSPDL